MCVCHGTEKRFSVRPTVKLLEVVFLQKLWWGAHDFEGCWKKLSRNAWSPDILTVNKNQVSTE